MNTRSVNVDLDDRHRRVIGGEKWGATGIYTLSDLTDINSLEYAELPDHDVVCHYNHTCAA